MPFSWRRGPLVLEEGRGPPRGRAGLSSTIDGVDVQVQAGGVADFDADGAPGTIVLRDGESVVMATRAGGYRIDLITPAGKRAMTPAAFLRGRHSREANR